MDRKIDRIVLERENLSADPLETTLSDLHCRQSVVSVIGSKGTDYRLHGQYCLNSQSFENIQVIDAKTGDTFLNCQVEPGMLFISDRGYGHRAGIDHVSKAGGKTLFRFTWSNLPLETREGKAFDLISFLSKLPEGATADWEVQTKPTASHPAVADRVVAMRKSETDTEKAIITARKAARKKKHEI